MKYINKSRRSQISVFCTCSWIWSLTCWEHHHWKRWGQLVKAPRHTYSGVLINRYCWRLLAFLALGLDYPSLSLHSVGFPLCRMLLLHCHCVLHLDCIPRLGRKKGGWHGMACMFVNTWFGSLISELSLPVNWVKFSKGGCVVAVALLNSELFKLQFRQDVFFSTSKVHFWLLSCTYCLTCWYKRPSPHFLKRQCFHSFFKWRC